MKIEKKEEDRVNVVYDICLDGTVVNALGMNVLHNTDGFNFQMPETFRYTEEHPYVSNGGGRNSIKGKEYVGVEADVCEFEDTYLHTPFNGGIKKFGLGIDEFCDASIQVSRKNYIDLMPDGEIKVVGNTLKSKKMPIYIEKFLNENIPLLLHGEGKQFLKNYYKYIEKIYNMQIPLREIASVGKIKVSLREYKEKCKEITKNGVKKARSACYELAIRDKVDVHLGDSIYYINTGDKKDDSDVKRVSLYYYYDENHNKIDYVIDEYGEKKLDRKKNVLTLTKQLTKDYNDLKKKAIDKKAFLEQFPNIYEYGKSIYPNLIEEDVVEFSCVRIDSKYIEDEESYTLNEDIEYNAAKYIDMFNSRIRPLFVCFDKKLRGEGEDAEKLVITNPKDFSFIFDDGCQLVAGQPFSDTDQDTYEQLMTMEDKEIEFWLRVGKTPPFVKECGMDWDLIVKNFKRKKSEGAVQLDLFEDKVK